MLEKLFGRPRVLQRIRSNPLGPVLEKYTAYLARRGHASCVVQQYVLAAEHFGRWLGRRPVNRRAVRTFIARHLPVCRCQPPAIRSVRAVRASLNHLLEMSSVPADQSNSAPSADDGSLLDRYITLPKYMALHLKRCAIGSVTPEAGRSTCGES